MFRTALSLARMPTPREWSISARVPPNLEPLKRLAKSRSFWGRGPVRALFARRALTGHSSQSSWSLPPLHPKHPVALISVFQRSIERCGNSQTQRIASHCRIKDPIVPKLAGAVPCVTLL